MGTRLTLATICSEQSTGNRKKRR